MKKLCAFIIATVIVLCATSLAFSFYSMSRIDDNTDRIYSVRTVISNITAGIRRDISVLSEKFKNDGTEPESTAECSTQQMTDEIPVAATVSEPVPEYMLSAYEGIIGVFDGNGQLLRTLDVPVISLPVEDRKQLDEGIGVYSWSELMEIIEDYSN